MRPHAVFWFAGCVLILASCSRQQEPPVAISKKIDVVAEPAPEPAIVRVPDFSKWKLQRTIPWNYGDATRVTISPDNRMVAVCGGDERNPVNTADEIIESGGLCVWDLRTGEPRLEVPEPARGVRSIHFFPEGDRLLVGYTKETSVIDARTGAIRFTVRAGASMENAFCPRVNLFTTMPNIFWDSRTGAPSEMPGVSNGSYSDFSPDGTFYCVDGWLYDLKTHERSAGRFRWTARAGTRSWTFSHSSEWITIGSAMWKVGEATPVWDRAPAGTVRMTQAIFSPDDREIFVSDANGTIGVYKASDGSFVASVRCGGQVNGIGISPDGFTLVAAIGSPQASVEIWMADAKTKGGE